MITILIAEDDLNLQLLYQSALQKANFHTLIANNGNIALQLIKENNIHLVVSDIMMPEIDGLTLVELLRQDYPNLPILMVTAKSTLKDKRQSFQLGVDDYMVKPIDIEEMVLRVEALLRRSKQQASKLLIIEKTQLNDANLEVSSPYDSVVELPNKEYLLLKKMLTYPNHIFTRQQLMDDIWGVDSFSDERTVDVHIKRLREKFEKNLDFDIITVRGLGYKVMINEKKIP